MQRSETVLRAWAEAISPPPDLTVTEWADERRILTYGAEQGPYRSSRTPYWREVADRFAQDDPAEQVVVMKGAQLGASEALLLNVVGYYIDIDPCAILVVRPTETDAEKLSKQKIQPMIDSCPALLGKIGESKSRVSTSTILEKHFPDGTLTLVGANSPTGLSSVAARVVICDETDRYQLEAGDEGDAIDLAFVRSSTYANRKMVLISTPATKGRSRIEAAYADSSRATYHVPCPECGTFQALKWGSEESRGGVKWERAKSGALRVWYACEHCDAQIPHSAKAGMIDLGVWEHEDPAHPVKGYHISGLYSPWLSWESIVARFLVVRKDPPRFKVWVNTSLGEVWDEDAAGRFDDDDLMALREPFAAGVVPEGAGLLTAAVDVQHNRAEFLLRAWGVGEESWTIDRRVLFGDPTGDAPWDALEQLLHREWPTAAGGVMRISAMGVDTGYLAQRVYQWCGPRHRQGVYAVKGGAGPGLKVWPRRPGKGKKPAGGSAGCPVYLVGGHQAKDDEMSRLRAEVRRQKAGAERGGPGAMHFPIAEWCDEDFFAQLTAEVKRPVRQKGRLVWEWFLPARKKNEVLDMHVYSYAVLQAWLASGWRLEDAVAAAARPVLGPAREPPPPKKQLGFQGGPPRAFGRRR